jgi:tetratricopeptide (TPR) repeat protein
LREAQEVAEALGASERPQQGPSPEEWLIYADGLREAQEYEKALEAYERARPLDGADRGIALTWYRMGRVGDALEKLKLLASNYDEGGIKSRILRADLLLAGGCVPLAVQELEEISSRPEASARLDALTRQGLRRFTETAVRGPDSWVIFSVAEPVGPVHPVRYLFKTETNASTMPIPTSVVTLSVAPARRKWSLGYWLGSWLRLRRPRTADAVEYSLMAQGRGRADVIAIWDREPKEKELVRAANHGDRSIERMQQAETAFHANDLKGASAALEELADIDSSWFFKHQPDYAALTMWAKVLHAQNDVRLKYARRLLEKWFPMWGHLAWASTLAENGDVGGARVAYAAAIAAAPLRTEGFSQLANFEWDRARALHGVERAEAITRTQDALGQLAAIDGQGGLLLQAEVAIELGSNALASIALNDAVRNEGQGEADLEFLAAIGQDSFRLVEKAVSPMGLRFELYTSLNGPPADADVIHHGAEIVVRDELGHHLKTIALSTQVFPAGTPRRSFLDLTDANGLNTIRTYEETAPALSVILQELTQS